MSETRKSFRLEIRTNGNTPSLQYRCTLRTEIPNAFAHSGTDTSNRSIFSGSLSVRRLLLAVAAVVVLNFVLLLWAVLNCHQRRRVRRRRRTRTADPVLPRRVCALPC